MKKQKHPRGYYRKAHEDARGAKVWLASKLAHIRPKAFRKKNYDRARNANEIAALQWDWGNSPPPPRLWRGLK